MSKAKKVQTMEGLAEAPLPEGQVWAYDTIEEIEVRNKSNGTLNLIVGGQIGPGEKVVLDKQTYKENQPWINGRPVECRVVRRTVKRIRDLNREAEEAARAKALMERQD